MRESKKQRITKETEISVSINLDEKKESVIFTNSPFFSHMLELFAKHSGFYLDIKAKGDTEIDCHHLVEDTAIVLGEVFLSALGDKKGIKRYSSIELPMDETLVSAALDISGRGYLVYNTKNVCLSGKVGDFDLELAKEFFYALAINAKITLHINVLYGENTHHIIEAMFKAVARVLKNGALVVGDSIPSTKGVL